MADVTDAPRPDTLTPGGVETTAGPSARRPSAWRLVVRQLAHASRDTWRTPVSMLITLAYPLLFLAISGLAAGATPGGNGDTTIQRLVPGAAVFAISMSAFVLLAYSVALAGEQGVLERLRGTPLPAWAYLAGRAGAAAWVAVAGTALMVAVGMLAYRLQVTPRMLPAAVLGLLVAIAVLATLGFALVMPSMFVVVLPLVVGNPVIDGVPFATSMTTGMTVFGAALTAYVALPELVAVARDRGSERRSPTVGC